MHPLLVSGAALAIYLVGWVPLAALLVYVLEASGNLGWEASAAIVDPGLRGLRFRLPVALVRGAYDAAALGSAMTRILTTNFGAAVGGSILLLAIARGTAVLLSRFATFHMVDQRFRPHAPLLFGMGVLIYLLSAGMHYAHGVGRGIQGSAQSRNAGAGGGPRCGAEGAEGADQPALPVQ